MRSHIVLPSSLDDRDIGEKTLDYSLPPKKIIRFISRSAFVTSGKDRWKRIDGKTVQTLARRSQIRVSQDGDFKEIIEEVKKAQAQEDKGLVLGESLEERKDKK